jgi:hypothetical protein
MARRQKPEASEPMVESVETTTEVSMTVNSVNEESKMSDEVKVKTETRKIDDVTYTVTFPDPAEVKLSAEQTAIAVKAFFAGKIGYLLRQDVKSESSTLEVNTRLLENMIGMAIAMGAPEDVAKFKAVEFLTAKDPNFRVESTKTYTYGMANIFPPPEKTAAPETPENQTEEEKPVE